MSGYKYHNGTRVIGGTAALLHKVKRDGGIQKHYEKLVSASVEKFIEDGILEMTHPEPVLRVIDGGVA